MPSGNPDLAAPMVCRRRRAWWRVATGRLRSRSPARPDYSRGLIGIRPLSGEIWPPSGATHRIASSCELSTPQTDPHAPTTHLPIRMPRRHTWRYNSIATPSAQSEPSPALAQTPPGQSETTPASAGTRPAPQLRGVATKGVGPTKAQPPCALHSSPRPMGHVPALESTTARGNWRVTANSLCRSYGLEAVLCPVRRPAISPTETNAGNIGSIDHLPPPYGCHDR